MVILKNPSDMNCSTTWYGNIVYFEHVVQMHAFGKYFSRFENKLHTWRGIKICQENKI